MRPAVIPRYLLVALVPMLGASAQVLRYTTSVVTTCVTEGVDATLAQPTTTSPATSASLSPGNVYCLMPQYPGGDCNVCALTSVYTTDLDVFCPTGTSKQPYTVTEVYTGMSALPTFETPTTCPYGFTSAVHTCTVCGSAPVTATMTYPTASHPYGTDVPCPTATTDEALPTAAGGSNCTTCGLDQSQSRPQGLGQGAAPAQGQGQAPAQAQAQAQTPNDGSKAPQGTGKTSPVIAGAGELGVEMWRMAGLVLVSVVVGFSGL